MSPLKHLSRLLAIALALTSCSGPAILDAIVPHDGYLLHSDIAYGPAPRQKLDIYVPKTAQHTPTPVILFFYGGSWQSGQKENYRFVAQALATKGYITVIADYRLYPQVRYPEFLRDSASAFVWTHNHIAGYAGDANRIFLMGHSAGAYNALMLTTNEHYIQTAGGKQGWIKGAIGLAGPYDFLPLTDPELITIFGAKDDITTQPIHYVKPGLPPIFLATGDEDAEVRPGNSDRLAEAYQHSHNRVTQRTYPGVAHIGIVLSLAKGFRGKAPTLEDIDRFIKDTP